MNTLRLFTGVLFVFFIFSYALSQQTGPAVPVQPNSNYNYTEAFGPGFYTKNGIHIRSAGGQRGHAYWQNRADYKLDIRLDEKNNEISGTEILTYTNNSPDKMSFIWMQLDQNLFKEDSRGHAMVPPSGSRSGAHGQKFDAGYKIKSVRILENSGTGIVEKDPEYIVEGTRMQIHLPSELAALGGKLQLKIEYSFISPEYGSDRMGILETKNGKIFSVAQ